MDTHFCVFHVASALTQRPHTQHHQSGGTGSAKTCEGARTMSMVLALHAPQSQWGGMEQTEGALTPPLPWNFAPQVQKPCWCRQAALWHFLATLQAIRCIF